MSFSEIVVIKNGWYQSNSFPICTTMQSRRKQVKIGKTQSTLCLFVPILSAAGRNAVSKINASRIVVIGHLMPSNPFTTLLVASFCFSILDESKSVKTTRKWKWTVCSFKPTVSHSGQSISFHARLLNLLGKEVHQHEWWILNIGMVERNFRKSRAKNLWITFLLPLNCT